MRVPRAVSFRVIVSGWPAPRQQFPLDSNTVHGVPSSIECSMKRKRRRTATYFDSDDRRGVYK
jgi:hypothetical protein